MAKRKGSGAAADEVVTAELPAPPDWKKTLAPKRGRTSKINEVVFIAPTGEEIKSKKQLDQYLRDHPGGPSISEFDWGTGDTPRRSARISERAKAVETEESEPPKKKAKTKTPSRKGGKQKKVSTDGDDEALEAEDDARPEEKEPADIEMKDAEEDRVKQDTVEELQNDRCEEVVKDHETGENIVGKDGENVGYGTKDITEAETEAEACKEDKEALPDASKVETEGVVTEAENNEQDAMEERQEDVHEVDDALKTGEDTNRDDEDAWEDAKESADVEAADLEDKEMPPDNNEVKVDGAETETENAKPADNTMPHTSKPEEVLPGKEEMTSEGPVENGGCNDADHQEAIPKEVAAPSDHADEIEKELTPKASPINC